MLFIDVKVNDCSLVLFPNVLMFLYRSPIVWLVFCAFIQTFISPVIFT